MELFTEIEFNKEELDQMLKVTYILSSEGWEVIGKQEFTTIKPNLQREVQAVKYKLKRNI